MDGPARNRAALPVLRWFALVAAVAVAGCADIAPARSEVAGAAGAPPSAPLRFVDGHVHLNDEAMQLDLMRRYGAERAVVFWGRDSDNESVAASASRHSDRFIAFASVSPERPAYRRHWDGDDQPMLTALDELLASGRFRGIGEISATHFPSPGFPEADYDPAGRTMNAILALARKHRVPVLVHVEWTRIDALSILLARFPDVPVIWAHGGYTPLFVALRMLDRHPNLHYELSARTWPVHPRSPDYTILRDGAKVWPQWLAAIESRSDRFLVGTDASQRSIDSDVAKFESVQAFLRQLTPTTRERVARTNLLALVAPLR
jgi:predicted TIM-barrel fold metal-dependent hydrolase